MMAERRTRLDPAIHRVRLDKLRIFEITEAELCHLKEKLRFILNREITFDRANAEELSRIIDLHYTAAYSTVQNCDRTFQNRCPKQWIDLTRTDDPKTRWCSTCKNTVTFCSTDEEVDRLSKTGQCVAFYDGSTDGELLGLLDFSEYHR